MKNVSSTLLLAVATLTNAQSTSSTDGVSSTTLMTSVAATTSSTPTVTPGPTLFHPNDAQSSSLNSIVTQVVFSYSSQIESLAVALENIPSSDLEELAATATFNPTPADWGVYGASLTPTEASWETILPADVHSQLDVLKSDLATALFSAVQTPLNSIYASEYGPNASPPWPTKGPLVVPSVPPSAGSGCDLRPAAVAAVAVAVGFAAFLM